MGDDILEKIFADRGYAEDFHVVMAKKDPEFLKLYLNLWESIFKHGNLDNKTASLVRLSAICALKIPAGLDHGMDLAKKAGASEEEIMDVIKIAYFFSGNASLIPALTMAKKKFNVEYP
jgi:alkylhydroperoxidase/carboxymuconolactone decarboxylase family protein YurZ